MYLYAAANFASIFRIYILLGIYILIACDRGTFRVFKEMFLSKRKVTNDIFDQLDKILRPKLKIIE